jgi:hypothetical protein
MRNLLIASLLAATTGLMPSAKVAPSFDTIVTIVPSGRAGYPLTWQNPPTYTCTAVVAQPVGGGPNHYTYALSVNDLVVAPGGHETKSASAGGYEVQLSVKINKIGDRADATVIVARDGETLAHQSTTVWLDRGPRRVD